MLNTALWMRAWREVRNFASQEFRLTPESGSIQIELISEAINAKNFCFRIKSKPKTWVTSINFVECCGSKFPFWLLYSDSGQGDKKFWCFTFCSFSGQMVWNALYLWQRWPESLFHSPTPLLFQNFGIRVRQFFKFENPTPVQTPATIINRTWIYSCFYLRNDHTDSWYCRNWKVTPDPVFPKFLTPGPGPGSGRGFENLWKTGTGSGVAFPFRQ